jgi:hypothetical protein
MPGVVFDPGYWGYHPALTGLVVKVNKCILKLMPGVIFDPGYWSYLALPGLVH